MSHGYYVTSEETLGKPVRYNCVAWAALGDVGKWWQASNEPDHFWPRGILDDGSFQSYVELYESLGYTQCDSRGFELFYEKIALFADTNGEFSHVSYQVFGGWTSKLGDRQDICHNTLAALEGGQLYGDVERIMKRRSTLRGFLARFAFAFTSRVWPIDRESLHLEPTP
jgi:hypothetical protein